MNRPLTAILSLLAVALTIAAGPLLADQVITLQPGETVTIKAAPAPATQPATQPTTKPTEDPVVLPGATPWPTPPKAGERWVRVLPVAIARPPAAGQLLEPGSDVSRAAGPVLLQTGEYTASGHIPHNLVAAVGATPVVKIKAGLDVNLPDVVAGVEFRGGGTRGDNLQVNGPRAGRLVYGCSFFDGEGLGLLVRYDGAQVFYCEVARNRSGSIGGTKHNGDASKTLDDVVVRGNYFHDNNADGWRNTHKFTRTEGLVYADNVNDRNRGGHLWLDNYNCRERKAFIARNYFGATTPDNKQQEWSVFAIRTELNGPAGVDVVDNYVHTFYSCDESQKVLVEGNLFAGGNYWRTEDGKRVQGPVLELRDDARDGMFLFDVTVRGNTFGPEAFVGKSSAGRAFTLRSVKVHVGENQWKGDAKPRVKVPA